MKSLKTCIIIAALCCIMPLFAQKNFGDAKYTAMCSYYGEKVTGNITAYDADANTKNLVAEIMAVVGLQSNFELRVANVPNAAAVLIKGKRYILYNPKFMEQINATTGTNWAAISILAHEIGHHLNGHTLDNVGSRPKTELEADEFSGFVLRKMGATLGDAQAVMSVIASLKGSHTHPAKKDRLSYIATGWNNAAPVETSVLAQTTTQKPQTTVNAPNTIAATTKQPAAPYKTTVQPATVKTNAKAPAAPAPKPKPAVAQTTARPKPATTRQTAQRPAPKPAAKTVTAQTTAKQSENTTKIMSDVYFTSNSKSKFYLTAQGKLVQVDNDEMFLVASLYKSDRQGYTMMFANNGANKIYVGNGGSLINEKGAKVGYLKVR
ncbi:MAG: hypothetical protein V4581_14535 [Bacteroidota bacterium]